MILKKLISRFYEIVSGQHFNWLKLYLVNSTGYDKEKRYFFIIKIIFLYPIFIIVFDILKFLFKKYVLFIIYFQDKLLYVFTKYEKIFIKNRYIYYIYIFIFRFFKRLLIVFRFDIFFETIRKLTFFSIVLNIFRFIVKKITRFLDLIFFKINIILILRKFFLFIKKMFLNLLYLIATLMILIFYILNVGVTIVLIPVKLIYRNKVHSVYNYFKVNFYDVTSSEFFNSKINDKGKLNLLKERWSNHFSELYTDIKRKKYKTKLIFSIKKFIYFFVYFLFLFILCVFYLLIFFFNWLFTRSNETNDY